MLRVRLIVEYDGTDFAGWQLQPGQRTVQGVLEEALRVLLRQEERVVVEASGRTDAGVHARGQVVAFDDPLELPLKAFHPGLQAALPEDLAVLRAEHAAADFDPRRNATGKRYVYRIWNGPSRRPLLRRSHWLLRHPLDLEAMVAAAALLVGEHDFKSFQAAGCSAKTTRRRLDRLSVEGEAGGEIVIVAEGSGFLRHMVRNLVGTLVEVGEGRRPAASVAAILAARDRTVAGRTAGPEGLCLDAVYYGAARDEA
ncbi:MAG: tRNA pseudouridine(38-40) synthase TruA [Deltaproteobacteria bacterium]|nr:tRNA pseudouridine(38-40) synthase TruA [Deltaproteobacteria bacterium]